MRSTSRYIQYTATLKHSSYKYARKSGYSYHRLNYSPNIFAFTTQQFRFHIPCKLRWSITFYSLGPIKSGCSYVTLLYIEKSKYHDKMKRITLDNFSVFWFWALMYIDRIISRYNCDFTTWDVYHIELYGHSIISS